MKGHSLKIVHLLITKTTFKHISFIADILIIFHFIEHNICTVCDSVILIHPLCSYTALHNPPLHSGTSLTQIVSSSCITLVNIHVVSRLPEIKISAVVILALKVNANVKFNSYASQISVSFALLVVMSAIACLPQDMKEALLFSF